MRQLLWAFLPILHVIFAVFVVLSYIYIICVCVRVCVHACMHVCVRACMHAMYKIYLMMVKTWLRIISPTGKSG